MRELVHSLYLLQYDFEYLLLLGAVVAIVLIGFKTYLPSVQNGAGLYYNRVSYGIMGTPNPCGDGACSNYEDHARCPADC